LTIKAQLNEDLPEAIGDDMEGAGAYTAFSLNQVDWLVVLCQRWM
jgi:nucleoside phosphorylase